MQLDRSPHTNLLMLSCLTVVFLEEIEENSLNLTDCRIFFYVSSFLLTFAFVDANHLSLQGWKICFALWMAVRKQIIFWTQNKE